MVKYSFFEAFSMNTKAKFPVALISFVICVATGLFFLSADLVGAADTVVPATIRNVPVEVRSGPNLAYHVLFTIDEEIEVSLIAKTGNGSWFYIRAKGMQGWIPKGGVRRQGNIGNLPVWSQPMGGAKVEASGRVKQETFIHSGPNVGYSRIASLSTGESVKAIARTSNRKWVYVVSDKGQGWVSEERLDLMGALGLLPVWREPTSSAEYIPLANTKEAVSLRSGPDRGYNKVGSLDARVEVVVISRTANKRWVFVGSSVGNGWVEAKYLDLSAGVNPLPIWGGAMSGARFEPEAEVISAEAIPIFAGARVGYNKIGELPPGTLGVLLARNGGWRFIKTTSISGWVESKALDIEGTQSLLPVWREATGGAEYAPEAVIVRDDIYAISAPIKGYSETVFLPVGTKINVIARDRRSKWYFIRGNGGQGWVPSTVVYGQITLGLLHVWNAPMPNARYEPSAIIKEEASVYHGPRAREQDITGSLNTGDQVKILAIANRNWFYVKNDSVEGWVQSKSIEHNATLRLLPVWKNPIGSQ